MNAKDYKYTSDFQRRLYVVNAYLGKVYFLWSGRNAWHSTWVRRYDPDKGCLFSTMKEAKEHAEALRKNGSVFYIQELPAVVFKTKTDFRLIVTQINTDHVLKNYSSEYIENHKRREVDIVVGDIFNSFKYGSVAWSVNPPSQNSIICAFVRNSPVEQMPNNNLSEFCLYKSKSVGSEYFLCWNKLFGNSNINANHVESVVRFTKKHIAMIHPESIHPISEFDKFLETVFVKNNANVINMSNLGEYITDCDPYFKAKRYGVSKLSSLIKKCSPMFSIATGKKGALFVQYKPNGK